ncbi:hypothetical protein V6N12_062094 [Hibiscus sabdariffa]|uniref:Secreted protein n=1 Tax=Hibiscus sabdariffa TaxID=183260 RepID=A0ABR2F7U8_9ROSI
MIVYCWVMFWYCFGVVSDCFSCESDVKSSYNVELLFAASFDSKMGCLRSVFAAKKQGKPIREVRTRFWKLREGENQLLVLLEGISVVERAVTRPRRPRESRVRDSALETPSEPCPRP